VSQNIAPSLHLRGFEQGLTTDTKHSIRQDESFGRHRPANVNSGQYSDSRQYDSQNNQRLNKDYVLVSKKEKNGYKSKNVMINQMKMEDLPAGDYEIVAMFDAEKGVDAADTSYRRPRLASYRQPSGGHNSFGSDPKAEHPTYVRPPGSSFNNDYQHQSVSQYSKPLSVYQNLPYETYPHHSSTTNPSSNYHHQTIYHPQTPTHYAQYNRNTEE
jgi:hypothetical protein